MLERRTLRILLESPWTPDRRAWWTRPVLLVRDGWEDEGQDGPPPPSAAPLIEAALAGLVAHGFVHGRTIVFDAGTGSPGKSTIGRTGANDVVLEDLGVSKRHAELVVADGSWTVVDVGSTNGTFVNGVRVDPFAKTGIPVESGDVLRLGFVDCVVACQDLLSLVACEAASTDWGAEAEMGGPATHRMPERPRLQVRPQDEETDPGTVWPRLRR